MRSHCLRSEEGNLCRRVEQVDWEGRYEGKLTTTVPLEEDLPSVTAAVERGCRTDVHDIMPVIAGTASTL